MLDNDLDESLNIIVSPTLAPLCGDVLLASFCPEGFVRIGVPIGTDAFVQNFVPKTCRVIKDDVEKLECVRDNGHVPRVPSQRQHNLGARFCVPNPNGRVPVSRIVLPRPRHLLPQSPTTDYFCTERKTHRPDGVVMIAQRHLNKPVHASQTSTSLPSARASFDPSGEPASILLACLLRSLKRDISPPFLLLKSHLELFPLRWLTLGSLFPH